MATINITDIPNQLTRFQESLYVILSCDSHTMTPTEKLSAYDYLTITALYDAYTTRTLISDYLLCTVDLLAMYNDLVISSSASIEFLFSPMPPAIVGNIGLFETFTSYSTVINYPATLVNTGYSPPTILNFGEPLDINFNYTAPTTTTSTTTTTTATPTTTPAPGTTTTTTTTTTAPLTASTTGTREPSVLSTVTSAPIVIATTTPIPEDTLTGLTTQPPPRPTTTRARRRTTVTTQFATRSPINKTCPSSTCNKLNY